MPSTTCKAAKSANSHRPSAIWSLACISSTTKRLSYTKHPIEGYTNEGKEGVNLPLLRNNLPLLSDNGRLSPHKGTVPERAHFVLPLFECLKGGVVGVAQRQLWLLQQQRLRLQVVNRHTRFRILLFHIRIEYIVFFLWNECENSRSHTLLAENVNNSGHELK